MNTMPEIFVAATSALKRHIAQHIAQHYAIENVPSESVRILQIGGPEHPDFSDAETKLLDDGVIRDVHGHRYCLHDGPAGDLLGVPVGMEWNEDLELYEWPSSVYRRELDVIEVRKLNRGIT